MTEEHPGKLETKILQLLRHEDRDIRDFGATIAPRIFPDLSRGAEKGPLTGA